MKHLLLKPLHLVLPVLVALAVPAFAQTTALKLDIGTGSITIDQAGNQTFTGVCLNNGCPGTVTLGAGQISWSGKIGSITVDQVTGNTKPFFISGIDVSSVFETGATGGNITVSFSDIGFNSGGSPAAINIVPSGIGSTAYNGYVDNQNTLLGTNLPSSVLIASSSNGGFISGPGATSLPFSMTLVETVSLPAFVGSEMGTFNNDFKVEASPNAALKLVCPTSSGTTNVPYNSQLSASGGVPQYTYVIAQGSIAPLVLDPNTGAITGTVTAPTVLTFTALTADNSGTAFNTATTSCSITFTGQTPQLTLACPANTQLQQYVPYSGGFVAAGGTGPYTFSIVPGSGSLPAGLQLDISHGTISGTPTGQGTATFEGQVTDSSQPVLTANTGDATKCNLTVGLPPPITSNCVTINAQQGLAITPVTLTASGGNGGPYTFSASGLPAGLTISSSGTISGTPTVGGIFPYTVTITDSAGNVGILNCSVTVVPTSNQQPPGLGLTKTASPVNVAPFQLVTYTYTVTNTGGTTLTNIVVRDDNGTPTDASDDFTVGTIASLAPGAFTTLTWTTYPTMKTVVLDQKAGVIPGGTLAIQNVQTGGCTSNLNCNLKFILTQALTLNDNCYGTPASGATGGPACVGWSNGHKFSDLTGSDQAIWAFYDTLGNQVLSFSEDYITLASAPSASCPNPNWTSYSSGYGTLGWCGGDGKFITGNSNWVLGETTTFTDALNAAGFTSGYTTNSPPQGTAGWNFVDGYTVIISPAAFGSNGFGSVAIPNIHNSPSKNGTDQLSPTPTSSTSINTAVATADGGITASASASVTITSTIPPTAAGSGGGGGGPAPGALSVSYPAADGTVGAAYSVAPHTQGGKAPYTYSLSAGTLPAGLTLSLSTGAVTGTPTVVGSRNVTITVADSGNHQASQSFTINISGPPLSLTVPPLGGAVVGKAFSATLTGAGGLPPYTFSIGAGTLAAGLSLNAFTGVISGTPTVTAGGPAAYLGRYR